MRVAIYARVSTEEQTVENQLMVLEPFCKQRDWQIVDVFQESESAWKSGHQTEFKKLTEEARKGKYDILLVWALDRLTREGALSILKMVDKFKQYNVRIISYQESWTELPGELADVLYSISGWVAQMESKRRSERTKAGLARAKEDGKGKRGPDTVRRKRRWFKRPG